MAQRRNISLNFNSYVSSKWSIDLNFDIFYVPDLVYISFRMAQINGIYHFQAHYYIICNVYPFL
jgi:hypothetical protein